MTTKQRAILRSMGQTIEPVLQIGKDGISENTIKQCWDALEARELIKVSLLKTCAYSTKEACAELCECVHAEPVQVIGRRFVIYRPSSKNPRIHLDEL